MYRRKGRSEYDQAVKKFLEHSRDPGRRLKALRQVEDKAAEASEVKQLYEKHSSVIFFIFYSYFGSLEAAILEKAKRGRGYSELHLRELRETALPALERIIVYLPELIHRRFQYNSICLIIRKLLHPDNVLKLRQDGLRVLILWLQALQNNAGDASMQLFASAVPHFPPQKTPLGLPSAPSSSSFHPHLSTHSLVERYGTYSSRDGAGLLSRRASSASVCGVREVVKVASLQPLHRTVYSVSVSATDHEAALQLIHHLMDCLTQQVGKLHWEDKVQHLHGFAFLFFLFKLFYLACLFKNFRTEAGIYIKPEPPEIKVTFDLKGKPRTLDALQEESSLDQGTRPSPTSATPPASCGHSPSLRDRKRLHRSGGYRMSQVIKLDYDLSNPVYDEIKGIILARILSWLQPGDAVSYAVSHPPPFSPLRPHPTPLTGPNLIAKMWFTSRDNVSLLCEVFRQGFLGALSQPAPVRKVVELYWGWAQGAVSGDLPPFMMPQAVWRDESLLSAHSNTAGAPIQPWEVVISYDGHDSSDVSAGVQSGLRMMIHHTSLVFLLPEMEETRSEQLALCRRILRFYQEEYLLAVLLHLTLELLRGYPPPDKDSSLAGSLAPMLLKTLLVCYLRASMVTELSPHLWDSLSNVLSSLTHWKEIIEHWKFVLDTMTHILAQSVYGVDLKDLPLHKLAKEESMIGRRHRTPSAAPPELSPTNFNTFSDIKADTNVGILPLGSRSAEERRSQTMRHKSRTVDVPQTPDTPQKGRSRRYISIPTEGGEPYLLSVNAAANVGGGGRKKERSVSEVKVKDPPGPGQELPARPSSSEDHYRTITEEEEEEGKDIRSPPISLPGSVLLGDTTVESISTHPPTLSLQRSERVEDGVDSHQGGGVDESLVNSEHPTRSPSPEIQSPWLMFERGSSVEPLIDTATTTDRPRERTKRSLFGRNRNKSESTLGGGGEGRSRRKSASAAAAKVDRDLVFANESSEGSANLLGEGGGGGEEMDGGKRLPLPFRKRTGESPTSSLTASWSAGVRKRQRGVSEQSEGGMEEGERGRDTGGRVYKSSSEGNIHQLGLLSEEGRVGEGEEEEGGFEDSQSVVGTPASSRSRKKSKKMSIGFSPQDAFSSSIIPSSQARLLSSPVGPRSQSPVLPSSLSPVHPSSLASPHSQLAIRRGSDHRVNGTGVEVEGGEVTGNNKGSRLEGSGEILTTPSLQNQRTPTPPNLLSPSSPPHTQVGWTPVGGAVVWQRIVKILGDINKIPDTDMHLLAFQTLLAVWRRLVELDANLGVSTDNQTTPHLPPYLPPLDFFLPWVLKACTLPPEYLPGRAVAIQLLCEINIRHHRVPQPQEQLALFYHLLQRALQPSSDTLYVAVKYCSKLFSYGLPGAGVLMADCITACSTVLAATGRPSDVPRSECLQLLGSMLFLPRLSPTLRNDLVSSLLTAARSEPTKNTRCMALYLVGMMAFSELFTGSPSTRTPEAVDILLASLTFPERSVAMTAVDSLTLLAEVAPQMHTSLPSTPARVLQSLCFSLAQFMTHPELKKAAWVVKVVVSLLLCLRDWLMVLPLHTMVRDNHLQHSVLQGAFKVLQAAATSCQEAQLAPDSIATQITVQLDPLDSFTTHNTSPGGTARGPKSTPSGKGSGAMPHTAATTGAHLRPFNQEDEGRMQVAARSVLTHLVNLMGHFPLGGGPAQMTSVVSEYHDSPSLKHLDDLSTEIFDSPRVQVFSLNDTAVVSLVEIPIEHAGLPPTVEPAKFQTRIIVRDVTGKYCWDCAMLYGPQMFPCPDGIPQVITAGDSEESISATSATADSASLEGGGVGGVASSSVDPSFPPYSEDPLQPPSWETHANSDRDTLEDLLKHIESTSPECVLYPGVAGLAEPAPVASKITRTLEGKMVTAVQSQQATETEHSQSISRLASVCGEREKTPTHISAEFAYHHCRLLLSHLGMFSASRRDHLDLLERNHQLILELRHLDSTPAQSRMTYKVAVLYVAPGQEDKHSVLRNSSGSREFEEFVAGLGWEVNMETHAGYMGGLKREFCAATTLPYYATSSEEVLFHVSTRMPSKGSDVEQKVRHLGNDEVHIVWSQHWRDYRSTIFKTQFADILIVIYPLPNALFRIELIKKQKQNILFGPLFDGAVVNRKSLPSLVRATAINALRAQRSPLVGYRGRYEERLKYIHTIVKRKMKSSFEEFTQNVIHPLESSSVPGSARVPTRNQTLELEPLPQPKRSGSAKNRSTKSRRLPTSSLTPAAVEGVDLSSRRSHSPRLTNLLLVGNAGWYSPHSRRPRANTNEDRRSQHSKSGPELQRQRLPRNRSVPEKLHRVHQNEVGGSGETTPPSSSSTALSLSASGTNLSLPRRPINIRRQRTASPSPTSIAPPTAPYRSGTS